MLNSKLPDWIESRWHHRISRCQSQRGAASASRRGVVRRRRQATGKQPEAGWL